MTKRCIFCEILAGRAPASFVMQDDVAVAFLDIQPVTPGHVLVIPRQHVERLADLPEDTGRHLFAIGQRVAAALFSLTGQPGTEIRCEGVNFFLADGRAAGQDVGHVHLHVFPRFTGDGFGFRLPPGYSARPKRHTLDAIASPLASALSAH